MCLILGLSILEQMLSLDRPTLRLLEMYIPNTLGQRKGTRFGQAKVARARDYPRILTAELDGLCTEAGLPVVADDLVPRLEFLLSTAIVIVRAQRRGVFVFKDSPLST